MPNALTADALLDAHRDRLAPAIPRGYRPAWYFGAVNLVAAIAIAAALARLHAVGAWEWLTVPAAFLVANWAEYRVHKGPMHHLRLPWQILFARHTQQHHAYFDDAHMSARTGREYYWVFFPWWAVGLVIVTAALFALPLALLVSANVGLMFFAVGIGYYLLYEWLHLAWHLPPQSTVGRLGMVRRLRRLHTLHHQPARMTRYNFNITLPICDWLFGTLQLPPDNSPAPAKAREIA